MSNTAKMGVENVDHLFQTCSAKLTAVEGLLIEHADTLPEIPIHYLGVQVTDFPDKGAAFNTLIGDQKTNIINWKAKADQETKDSNLYQMINNDQSFRNKTASLLVGLDHVLSRFCTLLPSGEVPYFWLYWATVAGLIGNLWPGSTRRVIASLDNLPVDAGESADKFVQMVGPDFQEYFDAPKKHAWEHRAL